MNFFSPKTFLNQNFPKNFFEPKFPKKLFWTILFPKNYFFPKNIFQRFFPKNFLNYFFPKNFFELFFFQKNYFQILFPKQSFQCLYSVYITQNLTNSHKSIDYPTKMTCVQFKTLYQNALTNIDMHLILTGFKTQNFWGTFLTCAELYITSY